MDFKDYIKEKYYDAYVQEKENLADRIIEARCNYQVARLERLQ